MIPANIDQVLFYTVLDTKERERLVRGEEIDIHPLPLHRDSSEMPDGPCRFRAIVSIGKHQFIGVLGGDRLAALSSPMGFHLFSLLVSREQSASVQEVKALIGAVSDAVA